MNGPVAISYGIRMFDGLGNIFLSKYHSFCGGFAFSQIGGDRRAERTTRSVRVFGTDTFCFQTVKLLSVKKNILGFFLQMPAFDDNRFAAHFQNSAAS